MSIKQTDYEELLAKYSGVEGAIELLKRYRPYLEMLPSMRRPDESLITIPLPIVKLRRTAFMKVESSDKGFDSGSGEMSCLPCDVAILMCDPEWKIKTGVELFVFIHRPEEDFSNLLGRWRQTQVLLSKGYEWDMPLRYRHILNEGTDSTYPLFIVFDGTPERIKRGLKGAYLPYVVHSDVELEEVESSTPGALLTDDRDNTLR